MVSFDTAATLSLIAVLAIAVYINRKKLTFHRFGIFYAAMYRTKVGIKAMENLARRHEKFLKKAAPWMILLGFIGMGVVTFDLARGLVNILSAGSTPSVGVVLPLKAKGVFYVPFMYWIISIFAILIIHEGAHGVMARAYNLPVRNSGLVVLGALVPIIPGAFVEPDEKQLTKSTKKKQLAVYAAGPVANIVTGLLFMAVLFGALTPLTDTFYANDGVIVTDLMSGNPPAAQAGITAGEKITEINGQTISTPEDFSTAIQRRQPGDQVNVITSNAVYDFNLGENTNTNTALFGVYVDSPLKKETWLVHSIIWVKDLVFWLMLLSLGVGLFNLVPLGPIDGGRMFLTALQGVFHETRANTIWKGVSFVLLSVLATNVLLAFI